MVYNKFIRSGEMIKRYKTILFAIVSLILISIILMIVINKNKVIKEVNSSKYEIINGEEQNDLTYKEEALFKNIDYLSSWIVYWDLNVNNEIERLNNKLDSLSYFAANFNEENKLEVPEELLKYYNDTKEYSFKKYITIVNDVIYDNGKSSLKDKEVLREVLNNDISRSKHINEIINLAKEYNFDGIEIDYEQIKDDLDLWEKFFLFIEELQEYAKINNLDLKVVLEPNIPIDKLEVVEGPTYVIMCYNLHGSFSKPGEKANIEFIEDILGKMDVIKAKKIFAIATGGFDWDENGTTKSVSEEQANEILSEYNIKAKRDDNSKYLYFNYVDKEDIKHEVWYADGYTLEYLFKPIIEEGFDISLWRLGGNLFN